MLNIFGFWGDNVGAAKKEENSGWKDGFLFLGNHLALDFLNTHPVLDGGLVELLPDFDALLRWFQVANVLSSRQAASLQQRWGDSSRAGRALEAVRNLREELRKEVLAWEAGGSVRRSFVEELNGMMAQHPMRTRLVAERSQTATELYLEPQEPEDLLAPLAHSAAMLFSGADRTRVRKCEGCVGHFYDTSKKGNRRWCSMQMCGNRVKVAAYAARQRRQS